MSEFEEYLLEFAENLPEFAENLPVQQGGWSVVKSAPMDTVCRLGWQIELVGTKFGKTPRKASFVGFLVGFSNGFSIGISNSISNSISNDICIGNSIGISIGTTSIGISFGICARDLIGRTKFGKTGIKSSCHRYKNKKQGLAVAM